MKIGRKLQPTSGGSNLPVVSMSKKVNDLELNEVLDYLLR